MVALRCVEDVVVSVLAVVVAAAVGVTADQHTVEVATVEATGHLEVGVRSEVAGRVVMRRTRTRMLDHHIEDRFACDHKVGRDVFLDTSAFSFVHYTSLNCSFHR